ncbi:MAG TPA: HAD family hydrolase, partial [Ramlibacter sp.]
DDVVPGLVRLKGKVAIGAITNGNADLRTIGLDRHFQAWVSAPQLGVAKPDPAIFLAGCRALDVAPWDAIYVGDDVLLDVQGAQDIGMRGVWMNRNGSNKHVEHGVVPDAIVRDFDELLDWLKSNYD